MAQAKFIRLLTRATGLCNTKAPVRLTYDLKTGESQLAQAVNVNIERDGRITRVTGFTEKRAESSSQAWSDGETCLFVSGTVLYQLHPDYSRTAIRAGLTLGAPMSFAAVADRVYYSNGHELGFVRAGADNTWAAVTMARPTTNVTFSDPPAGHLVAQAFGRMLVAVGKTIFSSEPAFYGNFNLALYRQEAARITMLRYFPGVLLVGTETDTIVYRGTKWGALVRDVVIASGGVLEGSDALTQSEATGADQSKRQVVFTTTKGICLGSDDGSVVNLTDENLVLPAARRAGAAVIDHRYVVHIAP